jgi:hypothetical protein
MASNFSIQYIYELIDKFSPVAQKINQNVKGIESGVKQAAVTTELLSKKLNKLGEGFEKTGRKMSMYLTLPIVGLGTVAVREFAESQRSLAVIMGLLDSNKNLAGMTKDEIVGLTDSFVRLGYDGTDIMTGVTQVLAKFPNITKDTFKRVHSTVVNIATATGQSLESVTQGLGMALTQPNAVRLLKKLGAGLTKEQAKIFESMRTHNPIKAQQYLLDVLDKKYGQTAEAAVKAGLGPLKVLSATFRGAAESFGPFIVAFILPLAKGLQRFLTFMTSLNPATKEMVVILLGVVAVLGPLAVGLGLVIKAVVVFNTVLTFLAANPIVLIIAAIIAIIALLAYGIYKLAKNWSSVWKFIERIMVFTPVYWIIMLLIKGFKLLVAHWDIVKRAFMFALKTTPLYWGIVGMIQIVKILIGLFAKLGGYISKFGSWLGKGADKLVAAAHKFAGINDVKASLTTNGLVNQNITASNKSNVVVTLNAPKGTVQKVESSSQGSGLRLGVNNVPVPVGVR